MNAFLDSSVVIAACVSARGASRAIFDGAAANHWTLQTSNYVLAEVEVNLSQLPDASAGSREGLRASLTIVPDITTFDWIATFREAKDRPILYTAAAWADVLLTLDRRSFADLLGGSFYGLAVLKPGDFLERERRAGRLAGVA